jgi:hypothetical protein
MLAIAIFWGLTLYSVGGCVFALVKGSNAERMAAGVIVANMVVGYGVHALLPDAWSSFLLVNDGLAAAALLVLAIRYAAPWLGGVMFFYTAQFALHSFYIVQSLPTATAFYADLNNLNFAGVTLCLIVGTAFTWRRRVRLARQAQLNASVAPAA